MIGSIFGDYYGSIFEKIPNLKMRQENSITDDSWLSFAYMDWLLNIDIHKLTFLKNKNEEYENKDFNIFIYELEQKAKAKIVYWYDLALEEEKNTDIPLFSPGMTKWAEEIKNKKNSKKLSKTNGCLMRNSPIGVFSTHKNLSLNTALFLSNLFAKITHSHPEALKAVRLHTMITYFSHQKVFSFVNFKKSLISDELSLSALKEPILFSDLKIKPIEEWKSESNKFIWDAKTSLDISMSCLYYANSYQEFLELCCSTEMDCDTYCAIGGDIAYIVFEKKHEFSKEFYEHLQNLKSYPKIRQLLIKS